MRRLILTFLLFSSLAWAQSAQPAVPAGSQPATPPTATAPRPSKADAKSAEKEFKQGLKLKDKGHASQAFEHFQRATELEPTNVNYVTAREITRQLVVLQDLERGNAALAKEDRVQAMAAFRQALELDPDNTFAKQRLRDSLPELPEIQHSAPPRNVLEAASEIFLQPKATTQSFKYRGDSRELLNQIATAFGLTPVLDESVTSRNLRFEVQDVDWATAVNIVAKLTKTFWVPLSAKQVLFASDTEQNRREFQRMTMRTFYLPDAATPQELNDVANTLRILFDIRFMTQQPGSSSIVVRAPQPVLDAAAQFLDGLSSSRPQVMLDIKVYEVRLTGSSDIGVNIPNDLTAYNVPTVLRNAQGGATNIQDIINQLIASGAINQANSTAVAALLAQGGAGAASLLTLPYFTFGGGITLSAVTVPPGSVHFGVTNSSIRSLEHATLRASQGNAADFKVGTRYPIVNATFAPIYNTPQISQVLQNQSYTAPVPSFTYEDLGLTLKATPEIRTSEVTLKLEFRIRALSTTTLNGQPIISNREYTGVISAPDGQSVAIAGFVSKSEQKGLSGIPLLSQTPGLSRLVTEETKQTDRSELLVVLTPHIVRSPMRTPQEIPLPVTAK